MINIAPQQNTSVYNHRRRKTHIENWNQIKIEKAIHNMKHRKTMRKRTKSYSRGIHRTGHRNREHRPDIHLDRQTCRHKDTWRHTLIKAETKITIETPREKIDWAYIYRHRKWHIIRWVYIVVYREKVTWKNTAQTHGEKTPTHKNTERRDARNDMQKANLAIWGRQNQRGGLHELKLFNMVFKDVPTKAFLIYVALSSLISQS